MTVHLKDKLQRCEKLGNLRQLQSTQHPIDFSSNDYLGLAKSSLLATSVTRECHTHATNSLNGLGSTGSRLLTGNSNYAENLENEIAKFHGYEAGLIFNCGYMANMGLLSSIATSADTIFFDSKVHASTRDGIRLSRAQAFPFRHHDFQHLESRLKNCSTRGAKWVCVESIYSTDGSIAPLREICRLAEKYEAHLIVDEAHATGVCGPCGRGLVAEYGLTSQVFAQITTFGKALGAYGAIILGSHILKKALINFATPFIYTTSLPLHSLAAIKCSYDLFPKLESERKHLQNLIQFFQKARPGSSAAHIQSVPIAGNEIVKRIAKGLSSQGFDVRALTSPTVQRGHEVLRICLHAFNTENELNRLLNLISPYRNLCHA